MMDARLPLFPLQAVLLPGELLPLHIFEERYKLMIGECLEEERPFGVVLVEAHGIRKVGCTARITRLLEKFPDGRMNILTLGGAPAARGPRPGVPSPRARPPGMGGAGGGGPQVPAPRGGASGRPFP